MAKLIVNELLPVTAALVDSVTPARPVSLTWIYGDDNPLDLYLADGEGGYHADSGTTGVTAKLAIVTPGAVPTGGTGLLAYNGNSSSAINYNTTAAQLQTAINAIVGIPQTVVVTGSDGGFTVEADTVGTWTYDLVNGDVTTFTPDGIFQIKEVTAGDGSTKQKYLIEIRRPEHSATTSWTQITNGWSGNFPVANEAVWGLFGGETEIDATLELQITDASGKVRTPLQQKIKLRIDGIINGSPNTSEGDAFYTKTEADNLFLKKANNLSGLASASTARSNLGISAANTPYTPTTGGDWTDPDPTDVGDALDTLKTEVNALSGGDESEYAAIAISAAGNTEVNPDDEKAVPFRLVTVTDATSGDAAFTHNVYVTVPAGGEAAPRQAFRIDMPKSVDPTINIRDASAGGTILYTPPAIAGKAISYFLELVYNGTAWIVAKRGEISEELPASRAAHGSRSHSVSGALDIDFAAEAAETVSVSADITSITFSNKPSDGEAVIRKTVYLETDGTARSVTWPASPKYLTSQPSSIAASKRAAVALEIKGSADTDITIAYVVEQ